MKLKEKMADEFFKIHLSEDYEGYDLTATEIFLSGFEKAREMAWEALGDTQYAVQPKIQKLLLELGEEEVG